MVARVMLAVAALFLTTVGFPAEAATRSECDSSTASGPGWFDTHLSCGEPPSTKPSGNNDSTSDGKPFYTAYRWSVGCGDKSPEAGARPCPSGANTWCQPDEQLYWLLGLHEGRWYGIGRRCATEEPTLEDAAPLVTPAMVLQEFRRVPLPRLKSISQPADATLVNFATVFRVEAKPLERTLTLAGQRVDLDITPSSFSWAYGDGTTATTRTPGAAYPSRDVVHRYQQAHTTVRHQVTVTWSARWRLNGGAWQDVPGTVTVAGPSTELRIAEATPALSGEGH